MFYRFLFDNNFAAVHLKNGGLIMPNFTVRIFRRDQLKRKTDRQRLHVATGIVLHRNRGCIMAPQGNAAELDLSHMQNRKLAATHISKSALFHKKLFKNILSN